MHVMLRTLRYLPAILLCLAFSGQIAFAQTYITLGINQPPELLASAGADQIICPGDSISIGGNPSATGGTPAYTYAWAPSTGLSGATGANPMASPAASTTYMLTVSDANNCSQTAQVLVTVDTCVGIADPDLPFAVQVYPNPSQGEFVIDLEGTYDRQGMQIRVFSTEGRILLERAVLPFSGKHTERLDLRGFSTGIYFLELGAPDGAPLRRRLIIQ